MLRRYVVCLLRSHSTGSSAIPFLAIWPQRFHHALSVSLSLLFSYRADELCDVDLLQSQRHQADLLSSLEAQVKAMSTKAASKEQAEEEQPILAGLKMIGGGAG